MEPTSFAELRAGCYDIDERVKDMDANGVLGSLCFPSFPQFCGQLFARTDDKDVALAMVRAYNDWHIEDWCGTHPGRFIPCVAAGDLGSRGAGRRGASHRRARAPTPSRSPRTRRSSGWPSLHSDHWDPFWQACSDESVVVCLHIGSSSQLVITSPDAPIDCLITLTPINIVQAAADLIWSPLLAEVPRPEGRAVRGRHRLDPVLPRAHRLPVRPPSLVDRAGLRRPAAERGLQRARPDVLHRRPVRHGQPRLPQHGQRDVGVRLPALRLDVAVRARGGLASTSTASSDDDIDRITHLNAMRHFSYDPFTSLGGRENCTVGALRAEAAGHDVVDPVGPTGHGRRPCRAWRPTSSSPRPDPTAIAFSHGAGNEWGWWVAG